MPNSVNSLQAWHGDTHTHTHTNTHTKVSTLNNIQALGVISIKSIIYDFSKTTYDMLAEFLTLEGNMYFLCM
jgi:hypothetical protein